MNDAMLQTILLVAIIIVAISLTGVVLLQRSEGGALGMGAVIRFGAAAGGVGRRCGTSEPVNTPPDDGRGAAAATAG